MSQDSQVIVGFVDCMYLDFVRTYAAKDIA